MLFLLFLLYLLQNIIARDVSGQEINFSVSKQITDNIFIYYYEGPTFDDRIIMKLEDGLSLTEQSNFDVSSTTIFYYHGWGETAADGSAQDVATAFLDMKIRNIVAFDYSTLVRNNGNILNYVISVYNATFIGQAIGEFFKAYIPAKQPLDRIKMVSHSLGAQIMAKTARVFGIGQLERLTALDPAGPLYNIPGIKHLDAKDGKFVDIIHTDGGFFGDGRTIGTVDFFPNKGTRVQPGCNDNLEHITSFCSHTRSHQLYAESIRYPENFLAKKCRRTVLFNECCCNGNDVTYMGYYIDTNVRGTYYLQTNAQSLFGEGSNGINCNLNCKKYCNEMM